MIGPFLCSMEKEEAGRGEERRGRDVSFQLTYFDALSFIFHIEFRVSTSSIERFECAITRETFKFGKKPFRNYVLVFCIFMQAVPNLPSESNKNKHRLKAAETRMKRCRISRELCCHRHTTKFVAPPCDH